MPAASGLRPRKIQFPVSTYCGRLHGVPVSGTAQSVRSGRLLSVPVVSSSTWALENGNPAGLRYVIGWPGSNPLAAFTTLVPTEDAGTWTGSGTPAVGRSLIVRA